MQTKRKTAIGREREGDRFHFGAPRARRAGLKSWPAGWEQRGSGARKESGRGRGRMRTMVSETRVHVHASECCTMFLYPCNRCEACVSSIPLQGTLRISAAPCETPKTALLGGWH